MYRNQRPIFTPLFLTPIIRTLKTEKGEVPKIKEGGGGEARSLKFKGGATSLSGEAKSLGISPRGQIPGGMGEIPATPGPNN